MKTTTFLPLPKFTVFGGALLNSSNVFYGIWCLLIVTLWNTHSVTAAPAKLDSLDSTFPLNFQPPVFEATTSSASSPFAQPNGPSAVDSYGNPIGSLQPIQTPDGRKVVSAQGLQFEIPNYASGITELKKPSDDLLPPFVDPIVVALPNATAEGLGTPAVPSALAEQTTSVDVESVALVELDVQAAISHEDLKLPAKDLPDYILELNDPDIAGPVDYAPAEDKQGLNVIAWDLLPPLEADIANDKTLSHNSISSGHNLNAEASQASSQITQKPQPSLRSSSEIADSYNSQQYRQSSTTTTTTTVKPTTTTTTRRTTTPRSTTTTTTTTTTTPEPDSSEFFKLEAGDSYTLPPWLQDIDDPDLDVAVTFEIPEDINEYNHTVERDLLAPLEPYTDLNNLHLTPPTSHKEDDTTTVRTTTTTSTTTRRPTASTYQPHWVRAKPTTAKPTIATFNKQFTSLNPSITSSTNFAQRTASTATTTTTTVKPKTSITYYNRQLSSNTAQTDKIGGDSSSEVAKPTNPFLRTFDDGKYKPQQNYRRTTTSTTTTTTTTPAPLTNEKNPFEPTIPSWLKDFDYPELGPGVPFIYDPNQDESPVDENILPPSKAEETESNSPSNPNSNPTFLNSQTPQGFTNKLSTSALSLTSSASIPSITTIPFPSAQQTNQDDSTFTQPPLVFAASAPNLSANEGNADNSKQISTTFNKHFAAPFDSSASDQNKLPLSADRESFPPFNSIITGSSTAPSKTTFSKSEDGKVITNNIFLNGGIGSSSLPSSSAKPIGSSPVTIHQENTSFTTQSSNGSTAAANKYTGRFGGPPGVLAPQVNGLNAASTAVSKSAAATTFSSAATSPASVADNKDKFTGSFGGPPGILKPFDNIKNR